ncbi:MAG: metal ABC transporter substrate-binding protein [Leucobacter sp.]
MAHFSHPFRFAALAGGALAATLALTSCGGSGSDTAALGSGPLKVVATTTQLTDFTGQVGGDDIELTGLLTPGASAHHFDPTPADLLALGEADVLVVNGANLETFIDSATEASGFSGEVIVAADGIDLAEAKEITAEGEAGAEGHDHGEHADEESHADHDHADETHADEAHAEEAEAEAHDHAAEEEAHADHDHADDHAAETATETGAESTAESTEESGTDDHAEEEHDHDHGDVNPHIWTSPRNAIGMVEEIAGGLAKADPDHAADFEQRATDYVAQLKALDEWTAAQFDRVPEADRVLVSGHDSLRYYLHDYDIAFAGSILPSFEDNAEPSAADVDALVASIKEHGVKAVFVESSMSPKLAQTIAKEAGVEVIDADTLYADSLAASKTSGEDTADENSAAGVDEGVDPSTYIGATVHNTRVILEAWGVDPEPLPASLQG